MHIYTFTGVSLEEAKKSEENYETEIFPTQVGVFLRDGIVNTVTKPFPTQVGVFCGTIPLSDDLFSLMQERS